MQDPLNRLWQRGGVKGDDLGTAVPIGDGRGGAKELLNLTKDQDVESILINAQAHTRYDKVEGSLINLADSIAGDDKGHIIFSLHMAAASVAELGLGRSDYMQAQSSLLVPSTLPVSPTYAASRGAQRENNRRWPLIPRRHRDNGDGANE